MKRTLRIMYAAGPGDVIGTYAHWKIQHDDPSQVSLTYSGQFFDFCRELQAQAYVLATHYNVATVQDESFTLEHRPKPWPGANGLLYHLAEIWYGLRLVVTAARFRADVIVVAEGTTHWFVLLLLPLLGIQLVPALHCVLWPKYKEPNGWQRKINRLTGLLFRRGCLALLTASDEISAQVEQITGGQSRPLIPFLPTYRRQTFAEMGPPPAEHTPFRVLFAGRIERNKGVFDLLTLAERFRAAGCHDIQFDLCGAGGALDQVRQAIAEKGLGDRFHCHGHLNRAEMQQMLRQSHVVIVPTTTDFIEGFNQVVVESVLAGRPVVTSSICPALHYVREAVVEVPPDDVAAYGDALLLLKDEPEFYALKQQACADYQEQFYDPARGWSAALHTAVQKRRTRPAVPNAVLTLPSLPSIEDSKH